MGESSEQMNDDDPMINLEPATIVEQEMDKLFDTNSYPSVDEIINTTIPKEGETFKSLKDAF